MTSLPFAYASAIDVGFPSKSDGCPGLHLAEGASALMIWLTRRLEASSKGPA